MNSYNGKKDMMYNLAFLKDINKVLGYLLHLVDCEENND